MFKPNGYSYHKGRVKKAIKFCLALLTSIVILFVINTLTIFLTFYHQSLMKPVLIIRKFLSSPIKVELGTIWTVNRISTMKLSVVFLTLSLAILANGDYTDPHWVAGSLIFLFPNNSVVLKCFGCRAKCYGSPFRMAMA